jgi:hypothetical protein
MQSWIEQTGPTAIAKSSPMLKGLMEGLSGFDQDGRPLFRPGPNSFKDVLQIAGAIGEHLVESALPMGIIRSARDIVTGGELGGTKGRALAAGEAAAQWFGMGTISRGYPGGPQAGEVHQAKEQLKYDVRQIIPQVRELALHGKGAEAMKMLTDAGENPHEAQSLLRFLRDPGGTKASAQRWLTKHPTTRPQQ